MNKEFLIATAKQLTAFGKGILAIDESTATCNKRFEKAEISQTEENRRKYRELIITTPNINQFISGFILCDETIKQKNNDGKKFVSIICDNQIIPGIKVDAGTINLINFPGEKVTAGLDCLNERLKNYYNIGARFAKWRAVININDNIPSYASLLANAHALARYAALCQENDLVPIVEPEVLMDGDHNIQRCYDVTEKTLHTVFNQLYLFKIFFPGMILKPNMILPGLKASDQSTCEKIAELTINCLLKTVPANIAGVAFLSGGQNERDATQRLNTMHLKFKNLPWTVTFSFARAIQQPALDLWGGKDENIVIAQQALYKRAKCNGFAVRGEYNTILEND